MATSIITPKDLGRVKPGLKGEDGGLNKFLECAYNHKTQMRNVTPDGEMIQPYPTSTSFDGDAS